MEPRIVHKARKLLFKIKAGIVGDYDLDDAQTELDELKNNKIKFKRHIYILSELQSYLLFARGEDIKSKAFIMDADKQKPANKKFLDKLGYRLLNKNVEEYRNIEVPATKFGGWLSWHAVGWVVAPLYILGEIANSYATVSANGELNAVGERIFTAAIGFDYFLVAITIVAAIFFFRKSKNFPFLNGVFWLAVVIVNTIISFYLAGELETLGENQLASEQYNSIFTVIILGIIWTVYYFRSIRVKGTFLN